MLAQVRNVLTACVLAASICKKVILGKLWGWGRKVQVNPQDGLLLAKSVDEVIAWDITAKKRSGGILEKLWCWDREVQIYLKDDLFLAKRDC